MINLNNQALNRKDAQTDTPNILTPQSYSLCNLSPVIPLKKKIKLTICQQIEAKFP